MILRVYWLIQYVTGMLQLYMTPYIDGLMQDCNNFSALEIVLLQPFTKLSRVYSGIRNHTKWSEWLGHVQDPFYRFACFYIKTSKKATIA